MSQEQPEDHEIVAMTKTYAQTRDGEYVIHLAFAEINRQGAAGRQWTKCPNCGEPYPLDREGSDGTVCSPECFQEYLDYVTREAAGNR